MIQIHLPDHVLLVFSLIAIETCLHQTEQNEAFLRVAPESIDSCVNFVITDVRIIFG